MGVCALELERDGDAIEHYEKFLEKGTNISPADRTQIENDLKALKSSVSWVTIQTDRQNVKIVDVRTPSKGFPVSNRYQAQNGATKIGIHPGVHAFTASVEGEAEQVWKVDISNGATYAHNFAFGTKSATPVPVPTPDGKPDAKPDGTPDQPKPDEAKPVEKYRPTPVATWVFGGLTVALAVPTAILMVRAKGMNTDYKAANGTLPAADLETQRSDVKTANLLADIFLGVTAASLVTTGITYLARPTKTREKVGSFTIVPSFAPQGGGAAAVGTF